MKGRKEGMKEGRKEGRKEEEGRMNIVRVWLGTIFVDCFSGPSL